MCKRILALVGLAAVAQSAVTVYDIGTFLSDLNIGAALGFQDDPSDTSTDCYASAVTTGQYI